MGSLERRLDLRTHRGVVQLFAEKAADATPGGSPDAQRWRMRGRCAGARWLRRPNRTPQCAPRGGGAPVPESRVWRRGTLQAVAGARPTSSRCVCLGFRVWETHVVAAEVVLALLRRFQVGEVHEHRAGVLRFKPLIELRLGEPDEAVGGMAVAWWVPTAPVPPPEARRPLRPRGAGALTGQGGPGGGGGRRPSLRQQGG